jgi:hypothetical protein
MMIHPNELLPNDDAAKYDVYGYEEAAPSVRICQSVHADDEVEFGVVVEEDASLYGYGTHSEGSPTSVVIKTAGRNTRERAKNPTPRRSSLKSAVVDDGNEGESGEGIGGPRRQLRRRASMGMEGHVGEVPGGPIRRRRSITFNEGVMVRKVLPTKSLTKNPDKLWFQPDEMERIQREVWDAIDKSASPPKSSSGDDDDEEEESCTRGLERIMSPGNVKFKRRMSRECVLQEQNMQREEGMYDDEQLAAIYKCSTIRSEREATRRAREDAKEAERYLKSARRMHRRSSM